MHDLGFFRANFNQIAERLATRGNVTGLDQFRELDQRRRAVITEAEELKARRNAESAEIAKLRKAGTDTTDRQQQVREIGICRRGHRCCGRDRRWRRIRWVSVEEGVAPS